MMKVLIEATLWLSLALSANGPARTGNTMLLIFRDVPLAELFEMLLCKDRVNIVLVGSPAVSRLTWMT